MGLFKSLETIAFFIKYLDREDLKMAWAAFDKINQHSAEVLQGLKHAKTMFPIPLIRPHDFNLKEGSEEAMEDILVRLERARGNSPKDHLKVLTALWLRDRMHVLRIPMPPRNVQSISFLFASHWLTQNANNNTVASLFAQVS